MKHTILFLLVALFLASCASPATPTPTQTFTPAPPTLTPTFTPTFTFTPEPPTFTPTPTLGIGSTEISPKDGMMLLYVPAGNFTMGDKAEDALAECQKYRFDCQLEWFGSEDPLHFGSEQPPHEVYLDAFWIDQTDVTNAMYAKCVADKGACQQPTSLSSATHSSYYSNRQFDDYPVINVNWNMADTYCKWAGRQLPTEAQWEKAASWDADKEQKRVYPWGDSLRTYL